MKIPTVEYCCCGFSVKLGTLAIAILSLVGCMGGFANTVESYYDVESVIDNPELDDPKVIKIREHLFAVQMYLYTCFVFTVTGTFLAAGLLMGYCTSNRTALRAWVMGTIFLQIVSLFLNIFMSILFGDYIYMGYNISVFINLYFVCVVNSYAQEIIKGSSSSIA